MARWEKNTSLSANLLSSVAAAALATLITGLLLWLIDAEVTIVFLATYGTLMAVFFFAMGRWKQRGSAR